MGHCAERFLSPFFFVKLQRVVASLPPWEIQVDFVVVARGRFWQPSFSTMLPGQLCTVEEFPCICFVFLRFEHKWIPAIIRWILILEIR